MPRFATLLLVSLVACGGGAQPKDDTEHDDAASDGARMDGGDDGARAPNTACGDAAVDGADTKSLWPLGDGYAWQYAIEWVGNAGTCAPDWNSYSVEQPECAEGHVGYRVYDLCGGGALIELSVRGGEVNQFDRSNHVWDPLLPAQPCDRCAWNGTTWFDAGSVTVPAGTFTDCWTNGDPSSPPTSYGTYCRGVGPVRVHWGYGYAYDAKLTSKSF